ncbi:MULTISPECIES: hypothetical protein [unclassified Streptomyces]|uniref:hypothetical protein n=1 Tax=unclassified Streptomyces TaxID=2593676 RepID=UPI00081D489F|nr:MULTISPECIES: hypothetical protein [unclassified Streptomyces]MYR93093.1 hypothetical protein [Streptomyces sp. SID4937]SCD46347.1 hypothetical protein GA0115243_102175 [Streptomyces sp. ScaeMP-e83]
MQKRHLARHRPGWSHPYAAGPFDPWLYADGGDGDDFDSGNDDSGNEGNDAGDQDDEDTGGTGDDDGQDDDAAKGEKPTPKAPAKKPTGGNETPEAKIARLEKELKAANGESAKARTTAKKAAADEARTEIVQELGKALGLIKDEKDTPPDPAALTAKIEQATAAHRETAVELAVYRSAGKYGADPDALTDSRTFLSAVNGLDPSDEGFSKAVSAAIKKAVEDNPKLKTGTQAPDRAAGDFNGGTGDGDGSDPTDIDEIRKARRKRRTG